MSTIEKPDTNFMLFSIDVGYGGSLVVPYADGVALINALQNAKVYKAEYKVESVIRDFQQADMKVNLLGATEYAEGILRNTILGEDKSS